MQYAKVEYTGFLATWKGNLLEILEAQSRLQPLESDSGYFGVAPLCELSTPYLHLFSKACTLHFGIHKVSHTSNDCIRGRFYISSACPCLSLYLRLPFRGLSTRRYTAPLIKTWLPFFKFATRLRLYLYNLTITDLAVSFICYRSRRSAKLLLQCVS